MTGGSAGAADRNRTLPRERGDIRPVTIPNTAPLGTDGVSNGPATNRCRSGGPDGSAAVERRVIRFEVEAFDGERRIGEGRHARGLVNMASFNRRLAEG